MNTPDSPAGRLVRAQGHLLAALEAGRGDSPERLARLWEACEAAAAALGPDADPAWIARARQMSALLAQRLASEQAKVAQELGQVRGLLRWAGALGAPGAQGTSGDSVDVAG